MEFLKLVKRLSAEEMHAMGEMLIELAATRNEPDWTLAIDSTLARFTPQAEPGLAELLREARLAAAGSQRQTKEDEE